MSKTFQTPTSEPDPLLGELGRNWGWTLALGLLFLILGAVGLAMLFGLTIVSILFIGVLMLAGGAAQALETFKCKGWKGALWHLLIAVLYILGGLVVIYDPASMSKLISLALGGVLTAVGVARVLIARQLRGKGASWIGMLLTGLVSVALGMMIMFEWPLSGLFAIALFIAFDLLLQGVSYVTLALTTRRRAPVIAGQPTR